jgi:peptide/nickel transport system permease protein
MTKYIARRLLQSIPTMLGITIISYVIMALAPGGPVAAMTYNPKFTPQERQALAEKLGVNDPIWVQYIRWLIGDEWRMIDVKDAEGNVVGTERGTNRGILRGDFGRSFTANKPAMDVIIDKIPATLELAVIAFVIGLLIGVPIGTIAAVQQGKLFDQITRVLAVFLSAVPAFWLGLILLLIFGSWLQILPMGNRFPLTLTGDFTPLERVKHLILPVLVLATGDIALYSRFVRAAVLDVLTQDYIRTAKSKGVSDRIVWFKHATRNALIPIATIVGPAIPALIGGSLIVEQIFSWPGMGRLAFSAVQQQDYAVVMGTVLLAGAATILGYLLTDILYALADPRVRLGG